VIGERYWATGITIDLGVRGWKVTLNFFDDGFAEHGSTEGVLRCRYQEEDLGAAIDTLLADTEWLGIRLGIAESGPTIYAADDREDLQPVANEQATRLGWIPTYRTAVL
jgi:hypothetical protein